MKNKTLVMTIVVMIIAMSSMAQETGTFTDPRDNQTYKTVVIGTQTWMAENLRATKYNNGDSIPLITDETEWVNLSRAGYCWYDNDEATYKNTYGALYNWWVVKSEKLCPIGWHVPDNAEWTALTDFLGGKNVAGSKLKSKNGWNSNTESTNSSGFNALPGGCRKANGIFELIGNWSNWWSNTEIEWRTANYWSMHHKYIGVWGASQNKWYGYSVRCVKNN